MLLQLGLALSQLGPALSWSGPVLSRLGPALSWLGFCSIAMLHWRRHGTLSKERFGFEPCEP